MVNQLRNACSATHVQETRAADRGRPAADTPETSEDHANHLDALIALIAWIGAAPEVEADARQEAARLVDRCWTDRASTQISITVGTSITSFPPLPPKLTVLKAYLCRSLVTPPDLSECTQLEYLDFQGCDRLVTTPDVSKCAKLKALELPDCTRASQTPDLTQCRQLELIDLSRCNALTDAPDLSYCSRLKSLDMSYCPALKAAVQQRVVALLDQLQTDPALRGDCCNLAMDAVNTCGDRIAIRLMDMEMLALEKRTLAAIEDGHHDADPKPLIDLCKGQHRLQILADEAVKK